MHVPVHAHACTLLKYTRGVVCPLSDVFQAGWAVVDRVHGRHVGQQRLWQQLSSSCMYNVRVFYHFQLYQPTLWGWTRLCSLLKCGNHNCRKKRACMDTFATHTVQVYLRSADVTGGLVASDVLLTRLQRQAVGFLTTCISVTRQTNNKLHVHQQTTTDHLPIAWNLV